MTQEIFDLSRFSLNGSAAEMESKMLDDTFVLGRMAILGQSTVLYAPPNAGKTLISLWLLIHAIQQGDINGADVFFVNADDNHRGLTHKLKLAEEHGFHMLAPGYNDFKAPHLVRYLSTLVKDDTAHGKVLVLDTVKKFVNLMRKDHASMFGESVRQFVSHGGTVIMLAHVNKKRDEDNQLVYSGTSDLVDDCDCAYMLDILAEDGDTRTVKFKNFKSRGDVTLEAVYEYSIAEGMDYFTRLFSVRPVTDEERREAERRQKLEAKLERNREAIAVIKECLRESIHKKTDLVKAVQDRSLLSRNKILHALHDHTGTDTQDYQYWHLLRAEKNTHEYHLNYGV